MKVWNKTRNTTLAKQLIIPQKLLDQSFGLLKYKTPVAMLLQTHFGIHTFGMHYPIDVLILNKNKQIVAVGENIKPNRIFLWNPQYETVLELPPGTIERTKTKNRDKLLLIN
ncbi:MAG TPA: DUF192 domain-containing protein [Candidatus Sulfotelmatobacter sp.]|jgi:uncharacterized membrane protein (UPF0127 family)|nr:DUF192 domain-containing protein [Candidatus Sulfotelmatobacter sp.]